MWACVTMKYQNPTLWRIIKTLSTSIMLFMAFLLLVVLKPFSLGWWGDILTTVLPWTVFKSGNIIIFRTFTPRGHALRWNPQILHDGESSEHRAPVVRHHPEEASAHTALQRGHQRQQGIRHHRQAEDGQVIMLYIYLTAMFGKVDTCLEVDLVKPAVPPSFHLSERIYNASIKCFKKIEWNFQ